ncbi:dUTP diphosphatase [Sporosarcina koreensis]|uniref:dUTP diphosphatase n=1 Tax=Sporosarcina koreensis TaxID=334735 RepID=UPI000755EB26|nr:dUTP diphosphatase [Sporosarcina koreensis]
MDLERLFQIQRLLDDRILENKGLIEQDLLPMKILALQVELGELANEWRGFKFWSEDREPRTAKRIPDVAHFDKTGEARYIKSNPLLEEYVDCLHFILSIGIELGCEDVKPAIRKTAVNFKGDELTVHFNEVKYRASGMAFVANKKTEYQVLVGCFLGLGEMFRFSWKQVEDAYYAKNEINHERQATGY